MKRYILRKENFGGLLYDRNSTKITALTKNEFSKLKNELGANDADVFETENKFTSLSAPTKVFLVLTNKCTLHCTHCLNDSGFNKNQYLSYETVSKIIDESVKAGVFGFGITGGEPLCHPDFFRIMEKIKKSGLFSHINTNAFFNDDLLEKLSKAGVDLIKISIDGMEECNDSIRGKGTFKRAVNAVKYLKSKGNKVRLNFTITEESKKDVFEFIKLADSLSCGVRFAPVKDAGRAKGLFTGLSVEEGRKLCSDIIDFCKNNHIKVPLEFMTEIVETDCAEIAKFNCQFSLCGDSLVGISFDYDGTVYPGGNQTVFHLVGKVGNIYDEPNVSFNKFWNRTQIINEKRIKNCKCDLVHLFAKSFNADRRIDWWKPKKLFRKEFFGALVYDYSDWSLKCLDEKEADNFLRENKNEPGMITINNPNKNFLSAPLKVFIGISSKCNLRCKHCMVHKTMNSAEPSFDDIKNIFHQLGEMGVLEVRLSGGEPTLRKDFFEIVEEAKKNNLSVSINSNGVFSDSVLKKLGESKIDRIHISLDGLETQHDIIRGNGVFKRVVSSIRFLKSKGRYIRIVVCIYKDNLKDIEGLVKLAEELDCDIKFSPVAKMGEAEKMSGLLNTEECIKIKEFFDSFKSKVNVFFNFGTMIPEFKEYCQLDDFDSTICGSGRTQLRVELSGKVFAAGCGDAEKTSKPLGTYADSFENMWQNSQLLMIESMKKKGGKCADCSIKSVFDKWLSRHNPSFNFWRQK